MASNLDPHQIIKRIFNEGDQSVNVTLPSTTNISLVKTEDSIVASADSATFTAAVTPASVPSSELVAPQVATYFSRARLYASTAANVTAGNVKLQVSPVDSGNIWVDLETFSLIANNATTISGTSHTITARRLRVLANSAPDANTNIYLVVGS